MTREVERLLRMAAHLAKYDPGATWTVSTERDQRYHRLGLVKTLAPSDKQITFSFAADGYLT